MKAAYFVIIIVIIAPTWKLLNLGGGDYLFCEGWKVSYLPEYNVSINFCLNT